MFIPKTNISIAEPVDVQMDELGKNITQMYHFIGINDEQVLGAESILHYMNEIFFQQR